MTATLPWGYFIWFPQNAIPSLLAQIGRSSHIRSTRLWERDNVMLRTRDVWIVTIRFAG